MNNSDSTQPIAIRAAALAAALLSATAMAGCSSSASKAPAAASVTVTVTSTPSATASPGTPSSQAGSSSAQNSSPAASATSTTPAGGSGAVVDCTASMLKLSLSPVREPINHVLIVAANNSHTRCRLNSYPALKYDPEQQAPVSPVAATKPSKPVVLAPGASAYAGLMTSAADGSGKSGKNRPTIELQLIGADGGSQPGNPAVLTMPRGSQYVDDSVVVTYWVTDQQVALT